MQTPRGGMARPQRAFPRCACASPTAANHPAEGTIQGVSGVVDKTTGAITLRVDFPNAEGKLRSGSVGTVLVPTQTAGAILVPQSATG